MIEEHLDVCLDAGINVEGINAEVASANGNSSVLLKGLNRLVTKFG